MHNTPRQYFEEQNIDAVTHFLYTRDTGLDQMLESEAPSFPFPTLFPHNTTTVL